MPMPLIRVYPPVGYERETMLTLEKYLRELFLKTHKYTGLFAQIEKPEVVSDILIGFNFRGKYHRHTDFLKNYGKSDEAVKEIFSKVYGHIGGPIVGHLAKFAINKSDFRRSHGVNAEIPGYYETIKTAMASFFSDRGFLDDDAMTCTTSAINVKDEFLYIPDDKNYEIFTQDGKSLFSILK